MLLEAATIMENDHCSVVLLDQVNPLPFMLGLEPPRGGNLWSGAGAPVQPAEQVFAGADWFLPRRHAQVAAPPDRIPLADPIPPIRAYSSPSQP